MKRLTTFLAAVAVLTLVLAACGDDVVDAGRIDASDPGTDDATDEQPEDDVDPAAEPDGTDEPSEPVDEPSDDTDDAEDSGDTEGTDDTDDATADDGDTTAVRLYFVAPGGGTPGRADPFLVSVQREIPSTAGIATATLRELVAGPSGADGALIDGISTSVPADTLVLGVNIADGRATIDLSREFEAGGGSFSMFSRLAQVVYTATQFPTVDEVEFMLDGRPVTVFSGEGIEFEGPVTRDDMVDLLPTVFVDTPPAGASVRGDLRMTGMAAVFEATFQYRLETAGGTVLDEGYAMTDNGVGWGAFDITIDVDIDEAQEATLTVWEYSAKDGSVQAERTTPLTLIP